MNHYAPDSKLNAPRISAQTRQASRTHVETWRCPPVKLTCEYDGEDGLVEVVDVPILCPKHRELHQRATPQVSTQCPLVGPEDQGFPCTSAFASQFTSRGFAHRERMTFSNPGLVEYSALHGMSYSVMNVCRNRDVTSTLSTPRCLDIMTSQ